MPIDEQDIQICNQCEEKYKAHAELLEAKNNVLEGSLRHFRNMVDRLLKVNSRYQYYSYEIDQKNKALEQKVIEKNINIQKRFDKIVDLEMKNFFLKHELKKQRINKWLFIITSIIAGITTGMAMIVIHKWLVDMRLF